ncbi:hypothetical protein V8D89_001955 [Ganoderma adspersum]
MQRILFSLNALAEDQCFETNVQALSVAISQPEGGGLPFEVTIGTADCETLAVNASTSTER